MTTTSNKLNLSLEVTPDQQSVQIVHNNPNMRLGKEIIRSIHVFSSNELEAKKAFMQGKIDKYNQTGII